MKFSNSVPDTMMLDESTCRVIAASANFSAEDVNLLRDWQCIDSRGLPLVNLLIDDGIFDRSAVTLLGLVRRGYVTNLGLDQLLKPNGKELLRKHLDGLRLAAAAQPPAAEQAVSVGGSYCPLAAVADSLTPLRATTICRSLALLVWHGHTHDEKIPPLNFDTVLIGPSDNVSVVGSTTCRWTSPEPTIPREEFIPSIEDYIDLSSIARIYRDLLTNWGSRTGQPIPSFATSIIERATDRVLAKRYRSALDLADAFGEVEAILGTPTWTDSVLGTVREGPAVRRVSSAIPTVGSVLGKCLLTDRLGQGGYGTVFRAMHKTLRVPVAVKILLTTEGHVDSHAVRFLAEEAHLLAQLNHPNIVRIFDFESEGDPPYIVMEYVEGTNLGELLQSSGFLQPIQGVNLMLQLADAVSAAEKAGIIHRDIKPANILISRNGVAKLADLGLGTVKQHEGERMVVGTALYMAPEQVDGKSIDHRADIYSLGVTFYQALTGSVPFDGESPFDVMLRHYTERPQPPHERCPGLPKALSRILLRMLEKKPEDRYQSGEELKEDLLAFLDDRQPTESEPLPQHTPLTVRDETKDTKTGFTLFRRLFGWSES